MKIKMDLEKGNVKLIIYNLLTDCLFIISITTMTFLLLHIESVNQRIISVSLSFILTCIITFKFKIRKKIFQNFNIKYSIVAILFALATSLSFAQIFYSYHIVVEPMRTFFLNSPIPNSLIMFSLVLLSLYAIYSFYYYFFSIFLPNVILFFQNLEKEEKYHLIASTIILGIMIIIFYSYTSVFYLPKINGKVQAFDVIYSTDTGGHGILNDYIDITAIENDLRQPLFGVFSLPFSIIAYSLGNLFNSFGNTYFVLIAIIQIFLMNIISILLSRLLHLKKKEKTIFMLFYTITYPFILFAFNLEQYVFGMFWLFCFLYSYLQNNRSNKFCFIAATGSLITTGILFPFLTNGKKIKQWLIDFIATGFAFFSGVIIFGQTPIILNLFSSGIQHVSKYLIRDVSLFNVICQYSHFVKNCFLAPFQTITEEKLGHISFQLAPANSLSIIGIVLFILVVISFIVNRKDKFAKICMSWVAFSIIILIVLRYGTRENGLILYSLYFGWAFVSLLFLLLKKLLQTKTKCLIILSSILIIGLLIINIKGLFDLLQFGLQYYDHIL